MACVDVPFAVAPLVGLDTLPGVVQAGAVVAPVNFRQLRCLVVEPLVGLSTLFLSKELSAGHTVGHAADASLEKVDLDHWMWDDFCLACGTPEGRSRCLRCAWSAQPALLTFIGSGNSRFGHRRGNFAARDGPRACGHVPATGHFCCVWHVHCEQWGK